MRPNLSDRAAGFVAKAMTHTHPRDREALLAAMMKHAAEGLRVIQGPEGASCSVYALADALAVARGPGQ